MFLRSLELEASVGRSSGEVPPDAEKLRKSDLQTCCRRGRRRERKITLGTREKSLLANISDKRHPFCSIANTAFSEKDPVTFP